jgi:hypothetical protein
VAGTWKNVEAQNATDQHSFPRSRTVPPREEKRREEKNRNTKQTAARRKSELHQWQPEQAEKG